MQILWRLAVLLALLTVACRAETNLILNVAADGSGTYTVEFGIDEELQQILGTAGEEGGLLPGFGTPIPGLTENPLDSLEQRVEGEMTFYTTTEAFSDPAQLTGVIESIGGGTFETFQLIVSEDRIDFRAKAELPEGGALDIENLPVNLDSVTEELFAASFVIVMPGSVSSNANEVLPDGSHRWALSLTEGVDIEATSDLSPGGTPWLLIVGSLIVLVVVVSAGFMIWRRRISPRHALEATAPPPPPMGFEPDSSTGEDNDRD